MRGQIRCVIAQRLDFEIQTAIATISTGNGERMRTFSRIKVDERKLPRLMPAPAGLPTLTVEPSIGCRKMVSVCISKLFATIL